MSLQNLYRRAIGLSLLTLASTAGVAGCHPSREYCNENWLCTACPMDRTMRCSFDGVEVTSQSCAEACHTRAELFIALCDARSTATREEIEAGTVCEELTDAQ